MRLLRMVEIRDLRKGDVLVTSDPERTITVGFTGDVVFVDDEHWRWSGSTLYIEAFETIEGHKREVAIHVVDGDENTKIGVWR